jgi:hypothetical protein
MRNEKEVGTNIGSDVPVLRLIGFRVFLKRILCT